MTGLVQRLFVEAALAQVYAEDKPGKAKPPDPGTGTVPPGEIGEKVLLIMQWIAWGVSVACVVGVMVAAAKMAISHRRGDDTNVAALGWVLAACLLFASAGPIVDALISTGD